ncbi:MAG: ferritin family protein [Sedimentisphaerales bacterium]|nr:ferritin family protein [Sedimentisphaerales bacterium]
MTDTLDIVDEILDFAIKNEIKAYKFYRDLAAKMDKPEMKKVFEEFADEEQDHKKSLEDIKKAKNLKLDDKKIAKLKLKELTVDSEPSDDIDYPAALILAMKKEKKAFQLYSALASLVENPTAKKLYTNLAQQEARHKLRFELEYEKIKVE